MGPNPESGAYPHADFAIASVIGGTERRQETFRCNPQISLALFRHPSDESMTADQAAKEKQMKTFTIDAENNVTAFASLKEAQAGGQPDLHTFTNEQELARLAGDWPGARLVEVWNGIPGVTPVEKFTSHKTAVARIWKAIQSLGGAAAETARFSPDKPRSPKKPGTARKTKKTSGTKKPSGKAQPAATGVREGSKTAQMLGLLQQPKGATLKQIMKATGWQAHSVRGFISSTLRKKMGLTIQSEKNDSGERTYKNAR